MAKLNFAVICGRAIIDRATNLLSIIDIVEEFTIKVPAEASKDASAVYLLQNPMDLVLDFSRSQANAPETLRVRVRAFAPNGNELGGSEIDIDLQSTSRSRGFVKMSGLPISSEGIFTFDVQALEPNDNWLTVTKVTMPVKIVPAD